MKGWKPQTVPAIPAGQKRIREPPQQEAAEQDAVAKRLCLHSVTQCILFSHLPVVHVLPEVKHFPSIIVEGLGHRPNSYRVSRTEPATSRKTSVLQKDLGNTYPGSMGVTTRVQSTFHSVTIPATPSAGYASLLRGGGTDAGGNPQQARKAGNRRNLTQVAGFPVHNSSRTKEGRRSETGNKPKVLKQIRTHRTLQDGGHPRPERPVESIGLDGKSGPERRVLYGANSRRGQRFPQVLVPQSHVPVQVPTAWPGMCPLGL